MVLRQAKTWTLSFVNAKKLKTNAWNAAGWGEVITVICGFEGENAVEEAGGRIEVGVFLVEKLDHFRVGKVLALLKIRDQGAFDR